MSDDLTSELDAIGKRLERPWTDSTFGTVCTEDAPSLLAAVRAVLEQHQQVNRGEDLPPICGTCHKGFWPCPTYLAITREITRKGRSDG